MGLSRRTVHEGVQAGRGAAAGSGGIAGEVARALEVNPNVLHRWRREFRQGPGNVFPGNGKRRWSEGRVARTGTQDRPAGAGDRFFEGVLAAHRGTADAAGTDWKSAVYRKIEEEVKAGRGLTVERMVKLGRVSRASFYRFDEDAETGPDPDMELRDAIQRIALEWPSYGRPRITRGAAAARLDGESRSGSTGCCARTICCACASASSW